MPAALKLVAIGGGEIRTGETLPIDREIVAFTGVPRPRALFIPTASGDADGYCETFRRVYGEELGCSIETLRLLKDRLAPETLGERIAAADLIYVGGGNTRSMLEEWRRQGIDRLLVAAAGRGTVLCGLSAGALCWFRHGNSDAPLIEGRSGLKTMRIDGLGLVEAALCPHLTREGFRHGEFTAMMMGTPGVGIGLDDSCAMQIQGGSYRILCAGAQGQGHRFARVGGVIRVTALPPSTGYRPLSGLLAPDPG
jgi:dipeptidase E